MSTLENIHGMQVPSQTPGAGGQAIKENFLELASRAPKCDFAAATDPTANDNAGNGYEPGSRWLNTTTGVMWECVLSTVLTATWTPKADPGDYYSKAEVDASIAAIQSSQWDIVANGISYGSGNVGIGTTDPQSKLHVDGTITSTDAVVNGNVWICSVAVFNGVNEDAYSEFQNCNGAMFLHCGNLLFNNGCSTRDLFDPYCLPDPKSNPGCMLIADSSCGWVLATPFTFPSGMASQVLVGNGEGGGFFVDPICVLPPNPPAGAVLCTPDGCNLSWGSAGTTLPAYNSGQAEGCMLSVVGCIPTWVSPPSGESDSHDAFYLCGSPISAGPYGMCNTLCWDSGAGVLCWVPMPERIPDYSGCANCVLTVNGTGDALVWASPSGGTGLPGWSGCNGCVLGVDGSGNLFWTTANNCYDYSCNVNCMDGNATCVSGYPICNSPQDDNILMYYGGCIAWTSAPADSHDAYCICGVCIPSLTGVNGNLYWDGSAWNICAAGSISGYPICNSPSDDYILSYSSGCLNWVGMPLDSHNAYCICDCSLPSLSCGYLYYDGMSFNWCTPTVSDSHDAYCICGRPITDLSSAVDGSVLTFDCANNCLYLSPTSGHTGTMAIDGADWCVENGLIKYQII